MEELANCPRCGRLFVRTPGQKVCPSCSAEVEEEFERVYEFIRQKENRQSTIYEVSEKTQVSVRQITEFVREGRIRIADHPNLAYPCERCGEVLITEGRYCPACLKMLEQTTQMLKHALTESAAERERYLQKKGKKPPERA
ncbi:MAG: zinc ribbon domain-containing protein [Hydrogenibacillus sp.]|nr:zinc ribbon domain-containing protein [Hydrogenibacillus sp.]